MSEPASLEGRIAKIFAENLNLVVPSPDTDLFSTGALDSLSFVRLLVHLEREYGVRVSLEDLELDNFRSIKKIAEFISRYPAQKDTGKARRGAFDQAAHVRSKKHG